MNPTVKNVLIISFKNAVNAILVNSALMNLLPTVFNMHSSEGLWNILKLAVGCVVSREGLVWGAKLLEWSQT
jgi:hypothetical protein